jgi:hypothetical protein
MMNLRGCAGAALAVISVASYGCIAPVASEQAKEDPVAKEQEALFEEGPLWPKGFLPGDPTVVPVCFFGSTTDDQKAKVRETLTHFGWPAVANIRFDGWDRQCDFWHDTGSLIEFAVVPNTNGDTVNIGPAPYTPQGPPAYTLVELSANASEPQRTYEILHETGHALGFGHEQARPDNWRPDGTEIFCSQNQPGETKVLGTNLTPTYDTGSVMSYCAGFVNNLSPGDVSGVRLAYGMPKPGWYLNDGFEGDGYTNNVNWIPGCTNCNGSSGIDYFKGFAHSGFNNGWVFNSSGWNDLHTHVSTGPAYPGGTCSLSAYIRHSPAASYATIHVRDSNDFHILAETQFTSTNGYQQFDLTFQPTSATVYVYVGQWGAGQDAWIQFDDFNMLCTN